YAFTIKNKRIVKNVEEKIFRENRFSTQTRVLLLKNVMNGNQPPLCISNAMMTPEVVSVMSATWQQWHGPPGIVATCLLTRRV
ncbi:hypothetical protein, partial [Chitinophaga sp.]|uniref:hypothetical protein n=1 Tax=Chitinophaga sp. TaxID=1869181 RepID=UPI002C917B78